MSYTEDPPEVWYCVLCRGTDFFVKKDDRWDLLRKLSGLDTPVCTKCHILMRRK